MTKNDLINDVAYELRDSMTREQIDRMKITLYVKLQDFELAEIKQLPMTMEHDNEWLMQRYCVDRRGSRTPCRNYQELYWNHKEIL